MELIAGPTPAVTAMLDRLGPALDSPLFGPGSKARLRSLARALPPARFLLFEPHLNAARARTDLSIGMMRSFPDGLGSPAWLGHPGPVLLEYDLEDGPALAGLFATFSRRAPADEAALAALAEGLLGPDSAGMRRMIALAAASQASQRSWITHFGAMLGRPGQPIRINVGGRSAADLRDYDDAVDRGGGAAATLDRLLGLFADVGGTRIAAIDLAETVQPRLGMEGYFDGGPGEWPTLLERLRAHGLCTSEEAAAICHWPAEEDADVPSWPEPFGSLDALLGPQFRGRLVRSINHVKLVAEADGTLRAKAYLAVHYVRDDLGVASGMAA